MTRKVAKRIVKGITDKIECNTADIDDWAEFWGFTREEYEEFLDMPIKALEQESVLDKIRAEIWDLQYGDEEKSMTDENRADAYNNAIRQVIEIIDKYKAESEG